MSVPSVSVLIIVYNRAHTIGAAVRSVLAQTMTDFELVVVDDGSSDGTPEVVASFTDPRVRLVRSDTNLGIPLARNRALAEARGRYIAWLDSDDLCHPERLAVQRAYLERHPEIAMIGSAARKVRADGHLMKGGRVPFRTHEEIRALLLFRSPFQQSSIFGRADALHQVAYNPDFPICEDVDMFARFTDRFRAENLTEFLIARRIHGGQTIRSNVDRIIERQMAISARALERLGVTHNAEELRRHVLLGKAVTDDLSDELIDWSEGWFARLLAANARRPLYSPPALRACFDHLVLKASVRHLRRKPAGLGRLLRRAAAHPRGAWMLARDSSLALLPKVGRPSAAGLRSMAQS